MYEKLLPPPGVLLFTYFHSFQGRSFSLDNEVSSTFGCQRSGHIYLMCEFTNCCFTRCLNTKWRHFSDVDECSPVYVESLNKTVILAGCDQLCNNTPGNYTCSCNKGFRLLYDGKQCKGKFPPPLVRYMEYMIHFPETFSQYSLSLFIRVHEFLSWNFRHCHRCKWVVNSNIWSLYNASWGHHVRPWKKLKTFSLAAYAWLWNNEKSTVLSLNKTI